MIMMIQTAPPAVAPQPRLSNTSSQSNAAAADSVLQQHQGHPSPKQQLAGIPSAGSSDSAGNAQVLARNSQAVPQAGATEALAQSPKLVLQQQSSPSMPGEDAGMPAPSAPLTDMPPPLPPLQMPQTIQLQQRQRQQLGAPLASMFPMPLSLQAVPPLFATPQELSLLEPQPTLLAAGAGSMLSSMHTASAQHHQSHRGMFLDSTLHPAHSAQGVLDLSGRTRTISSPSGTWEKPVVSSGHGLHHPQPSQPHTPMPLTRTTTPQASGMGSQQGMGSQHGGLGSTTSVAAVTPSLAAGLGAPGLTSPVSDQLGGVHSHQRVSSTDGGHRPLASPTSQSTGPSELVETLNGPVAAVVKQMLAEIPEQLQPVVMAKVATRGRGGRQPAADPRAVDPNMDPRKVRRILANRQSAARSKMKQRVLLETLRVNKEVMAAKQSSVQDELQRLAQLVHDLQARNKQLEERLQAVQQQQQPRQQGTASQNTSAICNNGWPGVAGEPPSPLGVTTAVVLNLDLTQHRAAGATTPTAKACGGAAPTDERTWWGEHAMDL